ncbi:MAG: arsenate reductase (thioredoxin) [Deltaproteobacteria bacterium]|jgi:arsenate reductase|nr:arsenate reductase (thioredoxin) [Deltaproteobacteria bacterium]
MIKVMFLCTGNSCRSQMAEGFAKNYGKDLIEAYSAGLKATTVNPIAVRVMNEIGIDISNQKSKDIDNELLNNMDVIITLCSNAEATCPMTPRHIKRLHWPIEDPAMITGSDEEVMQGFRRVRDEIKTNVLEFLNDIQKTV